MTSRTLAARLAALLAAAAALAVPDPSTAQAAGAWAPPVRLAENARTTPGGVAVAPDGTVVTAFARQTANPPASFVEVAVKPPGGSFGAPVSLGPGYSPRLASDAEGNVAVVWEQHIAGTSIVTGVTRRAGGGFTPVQKISDTGSDAEYPQVDIAGGKAVVVWQQGVYQRERVRAASAEAGEPFTVHDPLSGPLDLGGRIGVGVAPDGAAVVTWSAPTASGAQLSAAARPAEGAFAALPTVATVPQYWVESSRVDVSAEGRATWAWSYWDDVAKRYVVQSASRGRTGDFGGVETVETFSPSVVGGHLALDVSADGTAVLVWSDEHVRYALKPDGGGFGATRTVTGSHTPAYLPRVAFGGDGTAHAVWRTWNLPRKSVETTRIRPDGTSSAIEVIGVPGTQPGTSDSFEGPLLGLDADAHGNAAVTWYRYADVLPGPGTQITQALEVRIFDTSPPTLSDVEVPSAALTGRPVTMSATAADPLTPLTIRWKLGKYVTAQGPSIHYAYPAPGRYGVEIEAADAAGNATRATRFIQVDPDPNPAPQCPEGQICE